MTSVRSILQLTEIDSRLVRAFSGGISGGVAALIAFSTTETLLSQSVLVGVLTLLFMSGVGIVYNLATGDRPSSEA